MILLRAAIVDDEPLARTRVRRLLLREGSGRFDIVAECADALELLTVAAETELDVLFLDIDMPEYDAFQALERWQGPLPQLVFITAHALHGPRAFDVRQIPRAGLVLAAQLVAVCRRHDFALVGLRGPGLGLRSRQRRLNFLASRHQFSRDFVMKGPAA